MPRIDRYSQHFLRSPRLVAELIGHSNIRRGDTVYDLGAGSGIISSQLVRRCRQVVAIELEPHAFSQLQRNTASYDTVTCIQDDMMTHVFPATTFKVFANIPFHLSAPLVRRLTHLSAAPRSIYLITQQQFAHKLLADNRHFTSQLGATLAPWWQVRIRRPLHRSDFTPPPGVETCLLELKCREQPLVDIPRERYEQFVTKCFTDPRFFATVRSTIPSLVEHDRSPSQLTAAQWAELATSADQ